MPTRPKRPCSAPGCPLLTHARFCPEHEKAEAARYNKYDRDPATKRRYGSAWPRIRAMHLAARPLCEQCQREGRATPAAEVHHILPLTRGGTHAPENLMSLCKSCHSRITLTETRRGQLKG